MTYHTNACSATMRGQEMTPATRERPGAVPDNLQRGVEMANVTLIDLPQPCRRAYQELGSHPALYRIEAGLRFQAALRANEHGDTATAIQFAGLALGFLTLHQRCNEVT